jgi:cell division protein FtsL
MAAYQGARQRTVVLPRRPRIEAGAAVGTAVLPRRRMRAAVRARRGPSRLAILLAAIVVAFAGAFFSLSQDIRVSATGYEVDRLATQQERLEAQASDLRNELNRLGKAPAIRKLAIQAGLGPLPEPLVVTAR